MDDDGLEVIYGRAFGAVVERTTIHEEGQINGWP